MKILTHPSLILVLSTLCSLACHDILAQNQQKDIRTNLLALKNMIGLWEVKAVLLGVPETGMCEITWALDSSYLVWRTVVKVPSKSLSREFICYVTYNPAEKIYESNSFFSGTAFKVFHSGKYDAVKGIFHRNGLNRFPDGDEHVRNVIDISRPDAFTYVSYQIWKSEPEKIIYESSFTRIK